MVGLANQAKRWHERLTASCRPPGAVVFRQQQRGAIGRVAAYRLPVR